MGKPFPKASPAGRFRLARACWESPLQAGTLRDSGVQGALQALKLMPHKTPRGTVFTRFHGPVSSISALGDRFRRRIRSRALSNPGSVIVSGPGDTSSFPLGQNPVEYITQVDGPSGPVGALDYLKS